MFFEILCAAAEKFLPKNVKFLGKKHRFFCIRRENRLLIIEKHFNIMKKLHKKCDIFGECSDPRG